MTSANSTLTVNISVTPDGTFTYETTPADKKVTPEGQIKFNVDAPGLLHFAIQFKGLTPLEKLRFSCPDPSATLDVRGTAPLGLYSYFIAVYMDGTDGSKTLYTDDPEVIVEI